MATSQADQRARTWDDCHALEPSVRVAIKERAVAGAAPFLQQLDEKIKHALDGCHGATQAGDSALKELKEWIKQKDKVVQQHRDFEFVVGVAGTTGAGKTSLLNSILGMQEFLPSSCEQAATAVVCQVSWNHDHTPGHEYRAEVEFHTIEDVAKQLDEFFADINALKEVNDADYDDEEERVEDAAQAQQGIDRYLDQIQAVWGLEQQQLENMTAESLLGSNPTVLGLLGTTMRLYESDPDVLSQKVRPYIDSTKHTHGKGEQAFAAWPLVKQVHQYLRADILKHGIKLVDLPGLSDMSDSRAAVAESFYTKLNVTMIVAPIIRAADEKTAGSLLNERQELRLKMDGKFNKNGFGFILSKADDINVDSFLKRAEEDSKVKNIHAQVEAIRQNLAGIEGQLKTAQSKLQSLQRAEQKRTKMVDKTRKKLRDATGKQRLKLEQRLGQYLQELAEAKQAIQNQNGPVRKLMEAKAAESKKREHLASNLVFSCISSRNQFVKDRIQTDFSQRQHKFRASRRRKSESNSDGAGMIEVIPVSSVAFWQLNTHGSPLPGFPRESYTGVPLVKQWLQHSMLDNREEHLNEMLNEFSKLLNWVHQWSKSQDEKIKIVLTKRDVEETLDEVHCKYGEMMDREFAEAYDRISEVDPLRRRDEILQDCQKESKKIIGRWHLRFPDNQLSTEKMHWLTYQANLRRGGKKYKSNGAGKVEYHWVEQLAIPVLSLIAEDWDEELNVNLPALAVPVVESIDTIWLNYVGDVAWNLQQLDVDLADQFDRIIPALEPIKQTIRTSVTSTFRSISKDATTYHPRVLDDLEGSTRPIFESALQVRGTGSYASRRAIVAGQGAAHSEDMFHKTLKRMQRDIDKSKGKIPAKFQELKSTTINSVRRHISAMLDSLLPQCEEDGMSKSRKINLQKDIQMISAQWQTLWAMPFGISGEDCEEEVAIPEDFDEIMECEEDGAYGSDSSDSSNEDEDMDASE